MLLIMNISSALSKLTAAGSTQLLLLSLLS
jgi:hypothetical protein